MSKVKTKTCKVCKAKFSPIKPLQAVCGFSCALDLAMQRKERQERTRKAAVRRSDKERRLAAKPRKKWLEECRTVIHAYVRLRDANLGCVSCDKPPNWHGQWHASHFRPAGNNSPIRFNLWNIHKACSVCNNFKSGNLTDYETRLRAKIGDAKVDWLKSQTQPHTFTIEYLTRLKKVFTKKLKALKAC